MDFWTVGRDFMEIPTHNLFIPTKTTLMTKPKFVEAENELGVRLIDRDDKKTTTPKIDPIAPLNPLKGIRLQPNTFTVNAYEKYASKPNKPFHKLRRLSEMKPRFGSARYKIHRLFSTINLPDAPQDANNATGSLDANTRNAMDELNPLRHFIASQKLNESPFRQ